MYALRACFTACFMTDMTDSLISACVVLGWFIFLSVPRPKADQPHQGVSKSLIMHTYLAVQACAAHTVPENFKNLMLAP